MDHSVFLTAQNLVYSMGSNSLGQLGISEAPSTSGNKYSPILIEALLDVDPYSIECGNNHTLLLAREGIVYSWGSNKQGQCGVGTNLD